MHSGGSRSSCSACDANFGPLDEIVAMPKRLPEKTNFLSEEFVHDSEDEISSDRDAVSMNATSKETSIEQSSPSRRVTPEAKSSNRSFSRSVEAASDSDASGEDSGAGSEPEHAEAEAEKSEHDDDGHVGSDSEQSAASMSSSKRGREEAVVEARQPAKKQKTRYGHIRSKEFQC